MKNRLINFSAMKLVLFFFLFSSCNIFAQEIKIEQFDHPFLYLSAAYVNSSNLNHVTYDPYYSRSVAFPNETVRADLGLQFTKNFSFEFGYMRMPLEIKYDIILNEPFRFGGNNYSYTRISFYSFRLMHNLPVWKNRVFLKSGMGYSLGKSGVPFDQLGPSNPKTFTYIDNTITESSTLKRLHEGNSNNLIFNLGIEFMVFKKLSLFTNYTISKGLNDIQEEKINYIVNGDEGTFITTADGSFRGFELGIKFNFR